MINNFLMNVLWIFGVPDWMYDYAPPWVVLLGVIFTTQIVCFLIGAFLWLFIRPFFKEKRQQEKFVNKVYTEKKGYKSSKKDKGVSVHSYNIDDMHKMYNTKDKASLFSVLIKGFVLPFLVIVAAYYIAMGMAYG